LLVLWNTHPEECFHKALKRLWPLISSEPPELIVRAVQDLQGNPKKYQVQYAQYNEYRLRHLTFTFHSKGDRNAQRAKLLRLPCQKLQAESATTEYGTD
jgi:hypothetical protein